MSAPAIGSLWHRRNGRSRVRVVSVGSGRVAYQVIDSPNGRQFSTWLHAFSRRYEPADPVSLDSVMESLRDAARSGFACTVSSEGARTLLRSVRVRVRADRVVSSLLRKLTEAGCDNRCAISFLDNRPIVNVQVFGKVTDYLVASIRAALFESDFDVRVSQVLSEAEVIRPDYWFFPVDN